MNCVFQIVGLLSSIPFGGNQLVILPDAARMSTEGELTFPKPE